MNVLEKPMSIEEIKEKKDANNRVEGVVRVPLENIIQSDIEKFLDIVSEKLVSPGYLYDLSYSPVGADGDYVLIRVSGDATPSLEQYEEEDEE